MNTSSSSADSREYAVCIRCGSAPSTRAQRARTRDPNDPMPAPVTTAATYSQTSCASDGGGDDEADEPDGGDRDGGPHDPRLPVPVHQPRQLRGAQRPAR